MQVDIQHNPTGDEAGEQVRSPIANERQRHTLVGQTACGDSNIDRGLTQYETHQPEAENLPEAIGRMEGDDDPGQCSSQKQNDDEAGAGQTEFLAHNGKDRVGVWERKVVKFLTAFADALTR